MAKFKSISLLMLFSLVVSSCGYQFAGSSLSIIPSNIKTIAIPVFTNNTGEPNLEKLVTEAVVRKFVSVGRLTVVTNHEKADAILEGTITRYTSNIPLSFSGNSNIQEYRAEITGKLTLKETASGRIIWKTDNLYSKREYTVANQLNISRENELEAKKLAAFEFARDLAIALENF